MSFDQRDLHRPLDVFSRDNVYLGTILKVVPARARAVDRALTAERIPPTALESSRVNGELLGPVPTTPLGNPGPVSQSARGHYRADDDGAAPLGGGSIVVGRWWGLLGRREIPLDQVLNVSLERVILKLTYAQVVAEG